LTNNSEVPTISFLKCRLVCMLCMAINCMAINEKNNRINFLLMKWREFQRNCLW